MNFWFQSLNRDVTDVRVLNLLPQELSVEQEEPSADVYVEKLTRSVHVSDGERSRKTRQLNEESKEIGADASAEDNLIGEVTQGENENRLELDENKDHVKVKGAEHSMIAAAQATTQKWKLKRRVTS